MALLLAERLHFSQASRTTVPEERLKPASIWRELGVGLSGLDMASSRDVAQVNSNEHVTTAHVRRNSDAPVDSIVDSTPGLETDLSKPAPRTSNLPYQTSNAQSGAGRSATGAGSRCIERLKLATGRRELRAEALGLEHLAEDAAIAFLSSNRHTHGVGQMQHVMLAVA